jgi:hypothetical protein
MTVDLNTFACACSGAANKAEALKYIRTPEFVRLEEDLEFLLEYHLVECNELESKITVILKRLEHAEESVSLHFLSLSLNIYCKMSVPICSGVGSTECFPERAVGCKYYGHSDCLLCWLRKLHRWIVWHEPGPNDMATAEVWGLHVSRLHVVRIHVVWCMDNHLVHASKKHFAQEDVASGVQTGAAVHQSDAHGRFSAFHKPILQWR